MFDHVSKSVFLAALSLALGFYVGAHQLPATLAETSAINPEGNAGVTRFGPFDAAMFSEENAIDVGTEGELKLANQGGVYARTGHVELAPTHPDHAFDTVFIGIDEKSDAGANVGVQIRLIEAGGTTSRWQTVERESELVLARPAVAFQVRVVMNSFSGRETPRVRSVVVQVAKREQEPVDTIIPVPGTPGGQVAGVAANVAKPEIITRELWGARPPKSPYSPQTPEQLTVHHSSEPTQANFLGAASIRGIQAFHQGPERGWSDIGYHFLVAPDGKIYEGRPAEVVGAHSPPNTGKVGICTIGNFENAEQVTPAQRASLVSLLAYLAGKYKIAPSKIHGHRDFQGTDCPGQQLYDQLPAIRTEVGNKLAGR